MVDFAAGAYLLIFLSASKFKNQKGDSLLSKRREDLKANVVNNLEKMINNRVSMLSSNEQIFEEEKEVYEQALKESDFEGNLTYNATKPTKKRKRSRKIIWYNPPWSKSVKTPVGHYFLRAVDKCFPKGHFLHKFYNRNTLKISYCTTRNLKSHVDSHNKKILSPPEKEIVKCNCWSKFKADCPLPGQCTIKNVVYQADVHIEGERKFKTYYGKTKRTFKERYREHKQAFKNENSAKATALSRYIHKLRREGKSFVIKWSIKARGKPYQGGGKRCSLCLKEKTCIAMHDPKLLINKHSELLTKCTCKFEFELRNVKNNP